MPETVCVTLEQLREISVQYSGQCDRGGYAVYVCPACRMTAVKDSWIFIHAVHCWIGNAIAQAERLKDWCPKVGDRVRLRAMPEVRGTIAKIFDKTAYIQVDGEPEDWRLDRYLAELMPEEGE